MKIGELAKAAGVSKDTVRHYVERGLLSATKDPENGYQVFSSRSLSRLRFIKSAQALGFKLDDIQIIFQDAEHAQSPCGRVRDLIVTRMDETRRKIAELNSLCEMMENALERWREMPDQIPNGESICRLIESQPSLAVDDSSHHFR